MKRNSSLQKNKNVFGVFLNTLRARKTFLRNESTIGTENACHDLCLFAFGIRLRIQLRLQLRCMENWHMPQTTLHKIETCIRDYAQRLETEHKRKHPNANDLIMMINVRSLQMCNLFLKLSTIQRTSRNSFEKIAFFCCLFRSVQKRIQRGDTAVFFHDKKKWYQEMWWLWRKQK